MHTEAKKMISKILYIVVKCHVLEIEFPLPRNKKRISGNKQK